MATLITGGAGYIGSHTLRMLQEKGQRPVVLDNLSRGHRQAVGDAILFECNISDEHRVTEILKLNKITEVIHFAAESQVGESMQNPEKYYQNNVCGTLALLKAMNSAGARKIVFSSTAALFGEPDKIPIREGDPKEPTNVYGRTKLMIETMLEDYAMAYGFSFVSLRYFNAAGAHSGGELGEDHTPETHLIPIVLDAALGNRDYYTIFGDDYQTADGTCVRDYIHVSDLASAHLLALEHLQDGGSSRKYNLGNGEGFTVKQIHDVAEKVTGRPIPYKVGKRREGDPAILIASSEKIKSELGWRPEYGDIDKIIASAWKWHSSHPHGFAGYR